jgi:hypothetical protein
VIKVPPVLAGAVKATVACVSPAVATPIVGAPGTVACTAMLYAADAVALTPSVTVTVKFEFPAALGVPLKAPVDVFNVRPAGREPAVTA